MAKPIRNTPILKGKDAERFFSEIKEIPSYQERARERKRIEESVCALEKMVRELQKN